MLELNSHDFFLRIDRCIPGNERIVFVLILHGVVHLRKSFRDDRDALLVIRQRLLVPVRLPEEKVPGFGFGIMERSNCSVFLRTRKTEAQHDCIFDGVNYLLGLSRGSSSTLLLKHLTASSFLPNSLRTSPTMSRTSDLIGCER